MSGGFAELIGHKFVCERLSKSHGILRALYTLCYCGTLARRWIISPPQQIIKRLYLPLIEKPQNQTKHIVMQ